MLLVITPKFVYATARLRAECALAEVPAHFLDIQELAWQNFDIGIDKYSCLYVRQIWPHVEEVVALAKRFKQAGKRVVDSKVADSEIDLGKFAMYEALSAIALPVPHTEKFSDEIVFPKIVKWVYGFGGRHVHLVNNNSDLKKVLAQYPNNELIVQDLIKARYEYKVMTVGYKALALVVRFETNSKNNRPNFNNYTVLHADSEQIVKISQLAENSARVMGMELAKVDILEDGNGNLFVLEVNRRPGFQNFEKLSGYNVAADFVKYLK